MKKFEYYNEPTGVEHFGYQYEKDYTQKRKDEINNTPMTTADRDKALKELKTEVREHMQEKNKPYNTAGRALVEEFWADAREELGYDGFLTPEGVSKLESKAYEDGHAYGFSDVFSKLDDYTDFARLMIEHSSLIKRLEGQLEAKANG